MNDADSKAISSIRFPLAVMVVAIHSYFAVNGWALSDVKNYGLGCNSAQFFIISISHVIAQIAVPTFFLISGFLFFSHFGDGGSRVWKRKISNRIKTLLVPYLLWILLYIGYSALSGYKTILQDGLVEWLRSVGGMDVLWCCKTWNLDRVDLWGRPLISSAPVLVPFWFLRDLFICILFSPLFYFCFKDSSPRILKIGALVVLSVLFFTQTSLVVPGFSSLALFFFGVGSALSLGEKSLVEVFARYRIVEWVLFLGLFVVEVALDGHHSPVGNIIYPFFIAAGVASVWTLKPNKWCIKLERFTFFIFSFHAFILPFLKAMLMQFIAKGTSIDVEYAETHSLLVIGIYCLEIILAVLISMSLYWVLQKTLPRVCKVLCGR
ncbi:MAG: acyltransferase [Bacteroidales bacterium]|nr:acyltransferase [Bacteroidales bacterium]